MQYNFLMKEIVLILFALVSAVSLLYAEDLTYEEERVYNNEAFSIEERSVPLSIGFSMCLTGDTEPDISSSSALSVADAYNKKLQAEIRINY